MKEKILKRKEDLEARLRKHGIKNVEIRFLPFLEFDATKFATPKEVGAGIMILVASGFASEEPKKRQKIIAWLKKEQIWEFVSQREQSLFENKIEGENVLDAFLWRIEGAYVLAWALNIVKERPSPSQMITDKQFDDFRKNVPGLGEPLNDFLSNLNYRNHAEIYDENLFNELATGYLRDLLFSGNENESDIDAMASFERHYALNWLRRMFEIDDWDEVDTST